MNNETEILETLKSILQAIEKLNKSVDEIGYTIGDALKAKAQRFPSR